MLHEKQKDNLLSESRPELSIKEALQESGLHLHSQRMELYQANQLSDHSQREKSWLCTELDRPEGFLQENHSRIETVVLCRSWKSEQMRIDELSVQKKKGQSAENQLTVQIQELQDKANSLNDLREFDDPEMASSSGLFDVPSQPMSTPSPRVMLSRDSCLQLDTRNSFGTSGNVFEDPPALTGPPTAFFGNSRSHASAQCELVSLNTGRLADRAKEMERNTQNFAIPAPRFARKFSTWNPPSQHPWIFFTNTQ